jgi:broad specificity phosphatase PhoE
MLPALELESLALSLTPLQSYHDLAVRLEPIILELEREQDDLLIIAHESVLRVLYGYLMACDAMHIPSLKFPRNEIIEVSPPHPLLCSCCRVLTSR